jgi:hypothetical protein
MTDLDITNRGPVPAGQNAAPQELPVQQSAPQESAALGVFLALAAAPDVSFGVVELAGRGITADATATRWTLDIGAPTVDDAALADKLAGLRVLDDQLVRLWHAFRSRAVPLAVLESDLERIVIELETWPTSLSGHVDDSSADVSWDMP